MKPSKKFFQKVFLSLLCLFCLCVVVSWCERKYQSKYYPSEGREPFFSFRYISADLKIVTNNHPTVEVERKITEPSEVARFVKFFPGVGTKQKTGSYGFWIPIVDAVLTREENGKKITVRIVAEDKYWEEGYGDILVRGDLKEYLKNLVEGKTNNEVVKFK